MGRVFFQSLWEKKSVGIIATVLSVVVAIAFMGYTIVIDYYEGKLGGQLVLALGDHGNQGELNSNAPTYFFYSMPKDADSARILVPIELAVLNTATVRDNKVSLSFAFDKQNGRGTIPEDVIGHSGKRSASELSYETNSSDEHDYVNYKIDFLPTGDSMPFSEGAFATRIAGPEEPLLFGSGTGLDISVNTYSERDAPRKWDIRYRGIKAINNEGIQNLITNWYSKELAFDIRRTTGFWEYVYKLLFPKEVIVYGYSPDFQLIPNTNIFAPKTKPTTFVSFKFKPYSWRLLFK